MGINRMNENSIRSEILNDFGMKMPRVLVSGRYAVVDRDVYKRQGLL